MKASMAAKLDQLSSRLEDVERALQDPHVTDDITQYRKLTCEAAELAPVSARFREHQHRTRRRSKHELDRLRASPRVTE